MAPDCAEFSPVSTTESRDARSPRPSTCICKGGALEDWEREYIDRLVSPKIKDGQSVHHICVTNAAKLTRNERTIQRYVNYGILTAKRGDLKRACMVRSRKPLSGAYQHKVDTGCYVDRTYRDYEKFLAEHPGVGPVYMEVILKPRLVGIEMK